MGIICFCNFVFCRIQHELEVATKQAIFVDSSISDTIRTCIVLGNHRAAMKVKTEFKVCRLTHATNCKDFKHLKHISISVLSMVWSPLL